MNIIRTHQSQNFNHRPHDTIVSGILMHSDADPKVIDSLDYTCTPGMARPPVAYHCIVGRLGDVYETVDPDERAWHAGVSSFNDVPNCNDYMIGLCISNKQDGIEPYTEAALRAAAEYAAYLMGKYPAITLQNIVMHSAVAIPGPNIRRRDPAPDGPFNLSQFRELVADYRKQLA